MAEPTRAEAGTGAGPATTTGRSQRRLSNYLLDKSLQLRYALVITVISGAVAAGFGYLIYLQEERATEAILEPLAAPEFADEVSIQADVDADEHGFGELEAHIEGELGDQTTSLVGTMLGFGVGLMAVLSLYVILMTHKVAGPLYKVSTYFDGMSRGELGRVTPLRRGDMLTDFYDTFHQAHDAVKERHRRDNEVIGRFLRACEDADVERAEGAGEVLSTLREHHERRERNLG